MEVPYKELLDRQKSMRTCVKSNYEAPSLPNRGATKKQREAFMQWNEKDKMVIFVLSQNISNSMVDHIQEVETSEEVWNCLEVYIRHLQKHGKFN